MGVTRRRAVTLRRSSGGNVPLELDVEVAAGRELFEMVAGDVGVELEMLRHLGRLRAVGRRADEEVDVPAGGIAEGAGDGGNRGSELVRGEIFVCHAGYCTYVRSGNSREAQPCPARRKPGPPPRPRCSKPCARSRTRRSIARSSS